MDFYLSSYRLYHALTETVKRLNLFIKGNVDVHDSLHSCRLGSALVWNGINEILRTSYPGCLVRLKHETFTRSDALLHSDGLVPKALEARQLELGAYPMASQFSRALFETKADAIILTIAPDVTNQLIKNKAEGFLFYPVNRENWTPEDKEWVKAHFDLLDNLDVAQSMANFTSIIEKIREQSDAPILIYNMSPIVPGEEIHCHQGMGESYSTRIRKFNLGLLELSENTGISIIDIDSLLARKGADTLKLDPLHLTPEGYRLAAEEVVRVLGDLGVLQADEA